MSKDMREHGCISLTPMCSHLVYMALSGSHGTTFLLIISSVYPKQYYLPDSQYPIAGVPSFLKPVATSEILRGEWVQE